MRTSLTLALAIILATTPIWAQSPDSSATSNQLSPEQKGVYRESIQALGGPEMTEDVSKRIMNIIAGIPEKERDSIVATALDLAAQGVAPETSILMAQQFQVEKQLAEKEAEQQLAETSAQKKFLGFDWSLGVGLSGDLEGESRVESAEVVNGIVRVTEESSFQPRIILETHYLFPLGATEKGQPTGVTWGHGPFVGIQSSGNEVIESFSLGYMHGWRRDPAKSASFNVGLGAIYDHKVQVLGDGLKANEPLPDGETEIRFKTEGRWGALVMVSFSF